MRHYRSGCYTTFVGDYSAARGRNLTREERVETAAGVTYARAYKARCEHALDPKGESWSGSSREDLQNHGKFELE